MGSLGRIVRLAGCGFVEIAVAQAAAPRLGEACQWTVPEALICALEAVDFEDAIRNAISLGGDSDTLAAIAGSIAHARFGLPTRLWNRASVHLDPAMTAVVDRFLARCPRAGPLPG